MAKNSFFIRARVNAGHAEAFQQTEIDLGSYTNLGSSKPEVLRIHSHQLQLANSSGTFPTMGANKGGEIAWQLTTQSQTAMVTLVNDSYVAGGTGAYRNGDSAANPPATAAESVIAPQDWTAGSVIAVPTLFLGGLVGDEFTEDVYISLMLECTTEPMSKANAVSLAISQQ